MTLEQKEKLEKTLNYFSRKIAYCELDDKIQQVYVYQDRIKQIQEVLEILGYKVNKELIKLSNGQFYYAYTITG